MEPKPAKNQRHQWLSLSQFRTRLAHADAVPQLTLMGLFCGLLTALIAIAFRFAIDGPLGLMLSGDSENFESLPVLWRLAFPVGGALVLALLFSFFGRDQQGLGVGHVIERYQLFQANLPAKNALLQFIGGAIALISGQSMGREGPAVHLGAACSSQIGQRLNLPNNSLRVLVACGIASAIAASFNTPLAGVIFAMEVVLMEYTVLGFLPVILAAVAGSVLSQLVFGSDPAFSIPPLKLANFTELPWLLLCGICCGLLATLMLKAQKVLLQQRQRSPWLRFGAAGLITGLVACLVPEVMGLGYDTLEAAMLGDIAFAWLLVIIGAKTLTSLLAIGLGLPGGGIGPTLVIGACLGGALGFVGAYLMPEEAGSAGFYATLGMGAMMGAVLNAPLAALIAILELTRSPGILMPCMLVVVSATLTTRLTTSLPGLFLIGHDPSRFASPVMQMLNRVGITSIMTTNLAHHQRQLPWQKAEALLADKPAWIVIEDADDAKFILKPADLAHYLTEQKTHDWEPHRTIDLREVPGTRYRLYPIKPQATLQEALVLLKGNNGHAVYIPQPWGFSITGIAGVATLDDINNYYQL